MNEEELKWGRPSKDNQTRAVKILIVVQLYKYEVKRRAAVLVDNYKNVLIDWSIIDMKMLRKIVFLYSK